MEIKESGPCSTHGHGPSWPADPFHFNEDLHLYTLRRPPNLIERLLGVSDVIRDNGFTDDRFFTPGSRTRGRAVHAGLRLALLGTLDWNSLDPDLHGFVRSGLKLMEFLKADILEMEVPRYHPTWLYAGTLDLLIRRAGIEIVIDWKTGDIPDVTDYQLFAYDMLQPVRAARQHWGVKLHRDGAMATITELDSDRYAGDRFLNLLATTRERQKHGVSLIPTTLPEGYCYMA